MPENWVQRPVVNTEEGSNPGAPLAWGSPENPDDAVAGYGYVPCDTSEVEETFYYHSDHLGSTAYITDQKANVTQYDAYLPYGELLVDEHSSSADLPYKFNGKELDEETGLYYYGARYMNPVTSMWYGVDPITEKFASYGAYVYCLGNPIRLIDDDGALPSIAKLIEAAGLLGVEEAAIRAVYQTEVSRGIYDSKGRMKILYERHYFYKYTGGRYKSRDFSWPTRFRGSKEIDKKTGMPYPEIDHYGSLSKSYERFNKAMELDKEAACKSVSFGAFQIMGANYKEAGYSSASEFAKAMFSGDEDKMLEAFTNYIKSNSQLLKALRSHD